MSIASGTRSGLYEVRQQIGEGGMREVYLAPVMQHDRQIGGGNTSRVILIAGSDKERA